MQKLSKLTPEAENNSKTTSSSLFSMKSNGKTFHFASLMMPSAVREDVGKLYAFCRFLDDSVDLAPSPQDAAENLESIRQALLTFDQRIPMIADYFAIKEKYELSLDYALDLADGIASDIGKVRYQNFEDLIVYCFKVASTIGLMLCPILGVRDSAALPYAMDLGIAMQLTNIARDVKEDFYNNKVYLPEDLISYSAVKSGLENRSVDETLLLFDATCILLDRASEYYRSSDYGMKFIPDRSRLGAYAASLTYEEIGNLIKRRGPSAINGRVSTSLLSKITRAGKAWYELSQKSEVELETYHQHKDRLHEMLYGIRSYERCRA